MRTTVLRRVACGVAAMAASALWLQAQKRGPATVAPGGAIFAAPDGVPSGDGSRERPLDLATALSNGGRARPGDVIWLRGGTYHGPMVSTLSGAPGAPITVRGVPGERAVLDGRRGGSANVLTVRGRWTAYRDFEVTNSDPVRVLSAAGAVRGTGVDVFGPDTTFANLTVHDTGTGFGVWVEAENAELYGNLVFNNGWEADDRGHGHGIYAQNRSGVKQFVDNVVFNQFSHGIHVYGSAAAALDNFDIEGNVVFNNGAASRSGYARNILVGGETLTSHLKLAGNLTYYPHAPGAENNVGYNAGCRDASITANYFAGGNPLTLVRCSEIVLRGNTLAGAVAGSLREAFPDNQFDGGPPRETRLFVKPDRDNPGQGWIVVYNWSRALNAMVALDALGLSPGGLYDVYDLQDPFGRAVLSARYDGRTVVIPLVARPPQQPIGATQVVLAPTAPEFAVFQVRPQRAVPRASAPH